MATKQTIDQQTDDELKLAAGDALKAKFKEICERYKEMAADVSAARAEFDARVELALKGLFALVGELSAFNSEIDAIVEKFGLREKLGEFDVEKFKQSLDEMTVQLRDFEGAIH